MIKLTQFALTAIGCVVLAACSGGGSSGGETANSPINNSSTVTNALPASQSAAGTASQSSSSNNKPAPTNASTGGVVIVMDENRTRKVALTDASKFKTSIVVDGKEVAIGYEGSSDSNWAQLGNIRTCCGKYQDVRFGLVESQGLEEQDYFFYNGNPTKTMPTSGTASYTGNALIDFDGEVYPNVEYKLNTLGRDDDFIFGDARFTADFGNKSLSGSLTSQYIEPVNIQASITDNSFNGTAKSASFSTTANVEGKFYGVNAKELGGMFIDSESRATWGGVFGASQ